MADLVFKRAIKCTLIDVDVAALLVRRQDEPVIRLKVRRVLDDSAQVAALLHVILTSVVFVAHMRDFFVLVMLVVVLPLLEIVLMLVVFIHNNIVGVLLCKLEDDFFLLVKLFVVRVHQHELVVVRHVVELLPLLFVERHHVLLNDELRILVDQEREQGLVLLLAGVLGILQVAVVLQLELVVAQVRGYLRVVPEVLGAREDVRAEGVDGHERVIATFLVFLLYVANVLDGLLKRFHRSTILLNRMRRI